MFEHITNLLKYIFIPKEDEIFYYKNIEIINPENDLERVINVLNKIDVNILNYITFIKIHYEKKIPHTIISRNAWGTVKIDYVDDKLYRAKIHLVSSKFRNQLQLKNIDIENTLNHEIGHVYDAMIHGYINGDEENKEIIANNYANQHK